MTVLNYNIRYSLSNNNARAIPIADLKTAGHFEQENMLRIIYTCIPILSLLRIVLDLQDAIKRDLRY